MKTLSREALQRMFGDRIGEGGGGSSTGGSGGGVTMSWVEGNFISKDFFNQLFTIHGTRTYIDEDTEEEVTEDVIISPNQIADGDEYSLSNVEVSVGLWTQRFLSALGLNPDGGGGGGAASLASLLDVNITSPSNGQALIYNATTGKWVNGTAATGSVTSVGLSVPTGFSVQNSPVTSAGTLIIAFQSGYSLPTNAKQTQWDTAYSWGNHATAGYLTSHQSLSGYATQLWVNSQGFLTSSSLSGYATQSWVNNQGFLTSASGTFWGKSWSNGGTVSGHLSAGSSGGSILQFHSIELNSAGSMTSNGGYIDFHFGGSSDDYTSRIIEDSSGRLSINYRLYVLAGGNVGIGTNNPQYLLDVAGNIHLSNDLYLDTSHVLRFNSLNAFSYNGSQLYLGYGFRSTKDLYLYGTNIQFRPEGTLVAQVTPSGLRIGDGLISWDSANNALKVIKSDGTAANLYATGGISALGLSSGGGSTSISSLTLTSVLNMNNASRIMFRNSGGSLMSAITVDSGNNLVLGEAWTPSGYNTYVRGNYVFIQTGTSYTTRMTINANGYTTFSGYVQSSRFYLDASRYLYLSGSSLMYYNGSTSIQIA